MAYDIFHNYGFDSCKKKSLKESFNHDAYAAADRLMDVYWKNVQSQYLEGNKSPAEILLSLGFVESSINEHKYEKKLKEFTLVFDFTDYDYDDGPISYYVLDSENRIPKGYCRTRTILEEPTDWTNEGCSFPKTSTLKESYNNLPSWFTKFLNSVNGVNVKKVLSNRGIDLANAHYTVGPFPKSNRDPVLRDPSRLNIFRIDDGSKDEVIYIFGVNNPYLRIREEGSPFYDYKDAKDLPMKTILSLAKEYGYIDLSDNTNTNRDIRQERAKLKQLAGPQRGIGQYSIQRTIYSTDEYGRKNYDDPIGVETRWLETRGQDKSGYPLDPSKYIRMLDNVGLDSYGARLASYYNKIESARTRLISILDKFDIQSSRQYKVRATFASNIYSDIAEAMNTLSRAIEYYQRLKDKCEEIVERHKDDVDTTKVSEKINSVFTFDAKNFRDYMKETMEMIKHLENPQLKSTEED